VSAFRCGYAALVGRPNAGKSTLLNQLLGSKLAITSSKPQTTRNRIAGIHTDERMQVVWVDTPGVHPAWTELNRQMVQVARSAIADVDLIVWLGDMTTLARRVEAGEPVFDEADESIAAELAASKKPIVFVANKMDVVPKPLVLPVIDAARARLSLAAAVPTSALTGDGVPALQNEVYALLPEHPPLYPPDVWTELSERFLVAEIVREKIFHLTEQEIPYSTAVDVVRFDESKRQSDDLVRVYAEIVVERDSQKGILIGKGGEMLKRIGTLARKEAQGLLGCRVHLDLFVKVEMDWTKSQNGLRRVGYSGGE
jgi:GTP-binding protein Era